MSELSTPRLPPNQALITRGRWPLVGERSARRDDAPWTVAVAGRVKTPGEYGLAELRALPNSELTIDLHCVTRWSKFDVRFRGVRLADLLGLHGAQDDARFVRFVARTDAEHHTSLVLNEALELGALIAWEVDGAALPDEHGGPLRVVVPGRYFYKSLKWLERVELLAEDRLGTWESESGYHNHADPWLEQRYVVRTLSRSDLRRVVVERDVSGADLLGLRVEDTDLSGLQANGALLRDAHFERCDLTRAQFRGANLCNSRMPGCDLRGADLFDADLEGADLRGADLRGADLRGASLFGASFCSEPGLLDGPQAARVDATTRVDAVALERLTPPQRRWIEAALGG